MEKAKFPMEYLNISQGINGNFTHQGSMAIDLTGKDRGIDRVFSPFTAVVKRIYIKANAIWIESKDKIEFADKTVDYMTVLLMHDNNILGLKVGQVIKQGEYFYDEGTKGYATGNHIHLETAKGKFSGNGWHKNSQNVWMINNPIEPYKALYLKPTTKVLNGNKYPWKTLKVELELVEETSTKPISKIYVVKKGDTLSAIALKYKTSVDKLVKINNIKDKNIIKIGQIIKIQ